MHFSLLSLLALFYLLSFYFGLRFLSLARFQSLSAHRWTLGFAVICHWIFSLSDLFWNLSRGQISEGSSWLLTTATVGSVALGLSIRKKSMTLVVGTLPFISVALIIPHFVLSSSSPQDISLASSWLWTHIAMMILGEVFLFFCAMVAGLYLLTDHQLKKKSSLKFLFNLPPLHQQQDVLFRLLVMAFCFLSVGMLLGVFFAGRLWQGEWWLNSSILFSVSSWVCYFLLILFHVFQRHKRPRFFSSLVIFVFLLVFSGSLLVDFGSAQPHYRWPDATHKTNDLGPSD